MRVIGDILRLNAKRLPDKKALIEEGKSLTYLRLNESANRMANALLTMGVKPKDKIAVVAPNCIEWVILFYAVAKCGACVVPVNFRYKHDELVYVINNSDASIVFYSPKLEDLVRGASGEFQHAPHLIPMSGEPVDGLSYENLIKKESSAEPQVMVDPSWPMTLAYTSGTTGVPKGVLASHSAYINIYIGIMVEGDVKDSEVTLVPIPFFHAAGMHALVQPTFLRGGTAVIHGGSFDPDKILDTVSRQGVTMTLWVPTQLAMLLSHPSLGKHNLSTLKKIWYGSSPITPPVLEGSIERFKCDFYQFYGQTETGMVSVLPPEDHRGERSQFTGREFFNSELRVVDENAQDVKDGEIGEITSRQQGLGMIGYYKMDEANRNTIRNGWIHTGDVARREGGGYFTIVDRLKDMIISGAENIYPKEIEEVISSCSGVREVAVFGIPDDVYGEAVCAAIAKQPGHQVGEEDIIAFCTGKLSSFKKPKKVLFMEDLPKNAFGKVLKNELRSPFWAGRKKRI